MTLPGFVSSFRQHFPDLVGKPLLVALSGGADSLALLMLLLQSRPLHRCAIAAVHVNHHAREQADEDEAFCVQLSAELGITLDVRHIEEPIPPGVSREAWWRTRRYEAIELARMHLRCAATATAHTLDDQAETVLLKLLRGSGPRGVAGIRRRQGAVIRPLLEIGRLELHRWLTEQGRDWREDPSNLDPGQPRAWLRACGLPPLAGRFAGTAGHLASFAEMLAEDEMILSELAAAIPRPALGRPILRSMVRASPPALRRRWLLALASELPLAEPPDRTQRDAVEKLVVEGRPRAVDLGRHWVLRCRGDRLVLSPPPLLPFPPCAVASGQVERLPGGFLAAVGADLIPSDRVRHEAWLVSNVSQLPMSWRAPRAGEMADWPGATGRISHLLRRLGVPAEWRRAWPLLDAGGTMLWIPGVGTAPGWAERSGQGVAATLEEPWIRHVR